MTPVTNNRLSPTGHCTKAIAIRVPVRDKRLGQHQIELDTGGYRRNPRSAQVTFVVAEYSLGLRAMSDRFEPNSPCHLVPAKVCFGTRG